MNLSQIEIFSKGLLGSGDSPLDRQRNQPKKARSPSVSSVEESESTPTDSVDHHTEAPFIAPSPIPFQRSRLSRPFAGLSHAKLRVLKRLVDDEAWRRITEAQCVPSDEELAFVSVLEQSIDLLPLQMTTSKKVTSSPTLNQRQSMRAARQTACDTAGSNVSPMTAGSSLTSTAETVKSGNSGQHKRMRIRLRVRREDWTEEQDELILSAYEQMGNSGTVWVDLEQKWAEMFPSSLRTNTQLRSRHKILAKKRPLSEDSPAAAETLELS